MKVLTRLACLVVVIVVGFNVSAQEITGKVRGVVTDPAGAVVGSATITAQQTETGLTRSTTSNSDGTYLLLELPVGHYRVEASAQGFEKYVQDGITLNVNETVDVRVRLVVGAETQQILVSEDAQLIQGTVTSLAR
jgi:hypothetical protein